MEINFHDLGGKKALKVDFAFEETAIYIPLLKVIV